LTLLADGTFEGGGILGIAYAGALDEFDKWGVKWRQLAGTSAGAITAALLACGHNATSIQQLLAGTDFRKFRDPRAFRRVWDTFHYLGMCRGDAFMSWMDEATFGMTMGQTVIPLRVFTFDVKNEEVVAIDSRTHPDVPVALAVRMSMSVPFFFRAVPWQDGERSRLCVDGGIARNFPVETFDAPGLPTCPTFGFELHGKEHTGTVDNAVELATQMFKVTRNALAKELSEHNRYRTVSIDTGGISWLNFALSKVEVDQLIASGRAAAREFIATWQTKGGFTSYIERFRTSS
jgi:NTE family protein